MEIIAQKAAGAYRRNMGVLGGVQGAWGGGASRRAEAAKRPIFCSYYTPKTVHVGIKGLTSNDFLASRTSHIMNSEGSN